MRIENLNQTNITPSLYMNEELYINLLQHVNSTTLEVTFVLHIEKENNNKYVVQNFYFPPQWNEPAETKTLDSEYPKWCFELVKTNVKLNGHMHTHPAFGTTPSGYDIAFFKELIKDTKTYQFRLIMNQEGFIHCDLIDKVNGYIFYEIPVIVQCKGFNLIIANKDMKLKLTNKKEIKIKDITNNFDFILESSHLLINSLNKTILPTNPLQQDSLIKTTRKYQTNEGYQYHNNIKTKNHTNNKTDKYVQTSLFPDYPEEELDNFFRDYPSFRGA